MKLRCVESGWLFAEGESTTPLVEERAAQGETVFHGTCPDCGGVAWSTLTEPAKAGHTPGPWTVRAANDVTGCYLIKEAQERQDAALALDKDYPVELEQEEEANARLISLAPEMEEQLRAVVDDWMEFEDPNLTPNSGVEGITGSPVSGADLVDWFGAFRQNCKDILERMN